MDAAHQSKIKCSHLRPYVPKMPKGLKDAKVYPVELDEDARKNVGELAGPSVVNGESVHEQTAFECQGELATDVQPGRVVE